MTLYPAEGFVVFGQKRKDKKRKAAFYTPWNLTSFQPATLRDIEELNLRSTESFLRPDRRSLKVKSTMSTMYETQCCVCVCEIHLGHDNKKQERGRNRRWAWTEPEPLNSKGLPSLSCTPIGCSINKGLSSSYAVRLSSQNLFESVTNLWQQPD